MTLPVYFIPNKIVHVYLHPHIYLIFLVIKTDFTCSYYV